MNQKQILSELNKIQNQSIVIMGDIILDHYQWGEVTRISPEAPVPVVYVEKETYRLGGAANVAKNCKAMGADPFLIGTVGKDKYGDAIRNILEEEGIKFNILESAERKTTLKTRVIGNNQQIVRVDMENLSDLKHEEVQQLKKIFNNSPACKHLIISDYGKGIINKKTLNLGKEKRVIIDPKNKNFSNYKNGFIMTPNIKEAQECSNVRIETRQDIISAGKEIIKKSRLENLLITLGPQGMALFKANEQIIHICTSAKKVYDVTGAGDTVIGVLGACLEAGVSLETGCILANFAAGIVVGQVGTMAADKVAVEKAVKNLDKPEISRWDEQSD